MLRAPERVHSAFLLPAIVLVVVVQPMLAAVWSAESEALAFPLVAALVATLWSLDRSGPWFRTGLGLGLALLAGAVVHRLAPSPALHAALFGGMAALSGIAVMLGVRWLFSSARITAETLLSAVSVYLLVAISFGLVYVAIYALDPAAFSGVSPRSHPAETAELIYFSIGTLSTSAFGDILPTHPVTRLLANIEAVTGQLYMAVLVAILITGYARGPQQE